MPVDRKEACYLKTSKSCKPQKQSGDNNSTAKRCQLRMAEILTFRLSIM